MKLGIMVSSLGGSQHAFYLINYANQAVLDGHEITVFYEMPCIPCVPASFATMQLYEAFSYNGHIIATSMSLAHKLKYLPGPIGKYFYVWDLEWLRVKQKNYQALAEIYRSSAYRLIARSKEHARVITDSWNVPVFGYTDNFNIIKLIEMIDECNH